MSNAGLNERETVLVAELNRQTLRAEFWRDTAWLLVIDAIDHDEVGENLGDYYAQNNQIPTEVVVGRALRLTSAVKAWIAADAGSKQAENVRQRVVDL